MKTQDLSLAALCLAARRLWLNRFLTLQAECLFCFCALSANAQPPGSVAGTAIGSLVTAGSGSFSSFGYFFVLPANVGPNYQIIGIFGVPDSAGTYVYTISGTYGLLNIDTPNESTVLDLKFNSSSTGTFFQSIPPSFQQGNFELMSATAPAFVSGSSIYLVPQQGTLPFTGSGPVVFRPAPADNSYTLDGSAAGGQLHSTGTYAYSRLNNSAIELDLKDSVLGTGTLFMAFADADSGTYAIREPDSTYQIGAFTILNTGVKIKAPTSATNYITTTNKITLSGTAQDGLGIAQVTWSNNRGGSGTAGGTTNWNAPGIILQAGLNLITVTARDTIGATAQALFAVTYIPQPFLTISQRGTNVVMSWPTNVAGFGVESATNLFVGGWNTNYPVPSIVAGRYTVTNPVTRSFKVYRLFRP